jgi:hypothetical protein
MRKRVSTRERPPEDLHRASDPVGAPVRRRSRRGLNFDTVANARPQNRADAGAQIPARACSSPFPRGRECAPPRQAVAGANATPIVPLHGQRTAEDAPAGGSHAPVARTAGLTGSSGFRGSPAGDWCGGSILPGQNIVTGIADGLDNCDFVLLILSPDSVDSNWVRRVLGTDQ